MVITIEIERGEVSIDDLASREGSINNIGAELVRKKRA